MSPYIKRKLKNKLWHIFLYACAFMVLLPLFLVVSYVFYKGVSSLNWAFFTQLPRSPGEPDGGMFHAIMGTLYLVFLGSLMAVPVGIFCGIYLAEFGSGKVATTLRFAIDLLTGVPSIVVGIFAYIMIVVPFKSFTAAAGGFALAIIILPIVTRSTEEILKLVPSHIREAGLALGLPRWKVIFFIIVPGSFSGIMTGVILAISRAAGETAPLLFTAFGSRFLSWEIDSPMASLPVQIYNYAISPYDDWQAQAWAGSLVLIAMVLGLNLISRAVLNKKKIIEQVKKRL